MNSPALSGRDFNAFGKVVSSQFSTERFNSSSFFGSYITLSYWSSQANGSHVCFRMGQKIPFHPCNPCPKLLNFENPVTLSFGEKVFEL